MGAVIEVGFDYAVIDADGRDDVRDAATRIRVRMSRTVQDIIDIGRDLVSVKETIGHGHFIRWIEAEFSMGLSTAQNFMNVASRFGDKIPTVGDLAPSVLYALASPRVDDAVVEEVLNRAERGEPVTRDDVKSLKTEWASERKELKRQLDDEKLKAKDAKASQADFGSQLEELRSEMADLRDQRDTALHERDQARRGVFGGTKVVTPVDDAEAIERQVAALLNAWNKASPEARSDFMARIDTPIMDRNRAA